MCVLSRNMDAFHNVVVGILLFGTIIPYGHGYARCLRNEAIGRAAYQTDTYPWTDPLDYYGPSRAVDGNTSTCSLTHTNDTKWEVDLGGVFAIDHVVIFNKIMEPCCDNCYANATEYSGNVSQTRYGVECQAWTVDTPHTRSYNFHKFIFVDGSAAAAGNKCRDPDQEDGPWCYTMDPDERWDWCNVPKCDLDSRLRDVEVHTGLARGNYTLKAQHSGLAEYSTSLTFDTYVTARWIMVTRATSVGQLGLCEMQVIARLTSGKFNVADGLVVGPSASQVTGAASTLQCAYLCDLNCQCSSAQYHAGSRTCSLFSPLTNSNATVVSDLDNKYIVPVY